MQSVVSHLVLHMCRCECEGHYNMIFEINERAKLCATKLCDVCDQNKVALIGFNN